MTKFEVGLPQEAWAQEEGVPAEEGPGELHGACTDSTVVALGHLLAQLHMLDTHPHQRENCSRGAGETTVWLRGPVAAEPDMGQKWHRLAAKTLGGR